MNNTNPNDLFLENIECPDELLVLTSFEIGQIYEDLYGDDDQ
jgi:hypothetical protein